MSTTPGNERRQTAGKMNWSKTKTIIVLVVIVALLFFARSMKNSSGKEQQQQTPAAPVVVMRAIETVDLAAEREYVGRIDPIQSVSLRAQVNGEIAQVHFKEGSVVKAGQLLFSIDDKQYRAAVDARKADLAQAEANYDRASKYFNRLKASDQRSVSASALETSESDVLQGRAAVAQAKAALAAAQINLGYTKITAPISGRVGKAIFTKGNYVTSAAELTTIVQTDPVRVTFTLPDKDFLDQLDMFKNSSGEVYNVAVRLSNGEIYPGKGTRDFENNQVDTATGTMLISMRYDNREGLLVPGSMVRLAVKPSRTRLAVVVDQESVLADSQGDYLYIVDGDNVVHQRRVELGINYGVMREVISGVEAGEMVVTKGLPSIRDGITVTQAPKSQAGGAHEPAELAKESGFDLKPVSGETAEKQESSEGKN